MYNSAEEVLIQIELGAIEKRGTRETYYRVAKMLYDDIFDVEPYYPQSDIITNPPYDKATEFVYQSLKAIDEGQKVAMLLKLTFLETKKRKELFTKHPAKKIYVFSYRIECLKNNLQQNKVGSSAVCYAWYVWEKGYQGPMTIEII